MGTKDKFVGRKQLTATPMKFRVVVGIEHDGLGQRHEPGAIVELDPQVWDVDGFLACGAIIPNEGEGEVKDGGENQPEAL